MALKQRYYRSRIPTRLFAVCALVAFLTGCAALSPWPIQPLDEIQARCNAAMSRGCVSIAPHGRPEVLPLFDAHTHLNYDMPVETLLQAMDAAGVRRMALIPRHYRDDGRATDEQAADYARRYPDRFVAYVGGQRGDLLKPGNWTSHDVFLREAKAKLNTGHFRGVGEFIINHYGYNRYVPTTDQSETGDVRIPVDTPLMFKIMDLTALQGVPVLIHAEAEDETTREMRRLLDSFPRTKVIWAHNCGRASAAGVAEVLRQYPQLLCDLAGMAVPFPNPFGWGTFGTTAGREYKPGSHVTRVQNNDGTIDPSMRDLFETFPDRFIIGTDTAHPFQYSRYADMVAAFRRLLSQLKPETARKIGFDNATHLYGTAQ
jgi:predicted TIM-barrel fold metal-dependent hydrolase